MPRFCSNCGAPANEGAGFCSACGAALDGRPSTANGSLVGFSPRVNDPEILAALKKNRKAAGVFSIIVVPLPIIGFVIYSLVSGEMEFATSVLVGAIVSVIFLLFALYGIVRGRASNSYEAVVIKQKHYVISQNDDKNIKRDEYITVVQTTDGKKKKIREYDGRRWAYEYLSVGDRFKYHPQFAFPYELYDKTKTDTVYCVGCQTANPVSADRCGKCNLPLLK